MDYKFDIENKGNMIFRKASREDYVSSARISSNDNDEIKEALYNIINSQNPFIIEKSLKVITYYTQYIPCIDQTELIAEDVFNALVKYMPNYQNVYKIFIFLIFTVPKESNPILTHEIFDLILDNIYQNRKLTILAGIFELLDAVFTTEEFGFSVLEYFISKGILDLLSQQMEISSSASVTSQIHRLVSTIIQLAKINNVELSSFIPFLENMINSSSIFISDRVDICYALLSLSDNTEVFEYIVGNTKILSLLQEILEDGPTKELSPLFAIILKFAENDQYNEIFLNEEFFKRIKQIVLDPTITCFEIICHYLNIVREKYREIYENFGYDIFVSIMKDGNTAQKHMTARYIFDDINLLFLKHESDGVQIINEIIAMLPDLDSLDSISILDKLCNAKYLGKEIPYDEESFVEALEDLSCSQDNDVKQVATFVLAKMQGEE